MTTTMMMMAMTLMMAMMMKMLMMLMMMTMTFFSQREVSCGSSANCARPANRDDNGTEIAYDVAVFGDDKRKVVAVAHAKHSRWSGP